MSMDINCFKPYKSNTMIYGRDECRGILRKEK